MFFYFCRKGANTPQFLANFKPGDDMPPSCFTRLLALFLVFTCVSLLAQSNPSFSHIKKIYAEKLENNLDQYIILEILRQFHGSLEIVTEPSRMEAILYGVNIGAQNTTRATVNLLDPSGKVVLWSTTAGDRETNFSI